MTTPDTPAHTPLPWALRQLDNFGWNVVHYIDGDKFNWQRIAKIPKCADEANAAFIVRACNSHYLLTEALRALTEIVDDQLGGDFPEALADARAALSQAGGE